MRLIKRLGLFVLATSAVMAFASASMALAESTSLCDFDPGTGPAETCPEGTHRVTHIHEANLSGSKAKIVFSSATTECDVLFLGDTEPLAAPLRIDGSFTYSNCTQGCTVQEVQVGEEEKEKIEEEIEEEVPIGSRITILKNGHEKGDVGLFSVIRISCAGTVCRYFTGTSSPAEKKTAAGPLLALEANGEVWVQRQEINWISGFFCPEIGAISLRITPLTPLSIAR